MAAGALGLYATWFSFEQVPEDAKAQGSAAVYDTFTSSQGMVIGLGARAGFAATSMEDVATEAGMTIHCRLISGRSPHHVVEAEREAQKKLIAAQQQVKEKQIRDQTEADVLAFLAARLKGQ